MENINPDRFEIRLDTVKNNKEFYERLDELVLQFSAMLRSLTKTNSAERDQKQEEGLQDLILLIREGYDKGFNMIVRCIMIPDNDNTGESDEGSMNIHMTFMHTIWGRVYSFFSTKDKAQKTVGDNNWIEMPIRQVVNNLLNRKEAFAFTFNEAGKWDDLCIVPISLLKEVFPEDLPKPENFVESTK